MIVFPFFFFPLISAGTWLGMLLAMLIVWITEGSPHYASMDSGQSIAYISDIGAQGLKPLFITGCCVTTIFLDLAFVSERWLRHSGRLERNTTRAEKVLSVLAIIFAIAGTAGLILLSIFDTLRHPHLHDGFLLLFIAGYIISAIFLCAEYQRLGIHFRNRRILRISFWLKLTFILVELVLAIIFAVLSFDHHTEQAAVFEWVVALIFTFWVLSFFVDLLPASHRKASSLPKTGDAPALEMGAGSGGAHVVNSNGYAHPNGNGYTHTTTTSTTSNGGVHMNGYTTNGYAAGNGLLTESAAAAYGSGRVDGYADGIPGGGYRGNGVAGHKPVSSARNF
ncbi:hypothetical protein MMC34_006318 [Xylographa carneopallida]|nr:hypothetical protein [Xylographa carneopallida]